MNAWAHHLARDLSAQAARAGLLAMAYNGALVLRGRGQLAVWTLMRTTTGTGWALVWRRTHRDQPKVIPQVGPAAARKVLLAYLKGARP